MKTNSNKYKKESFIDKLDNTEENIVLGIDHQIKVLKEQNKGNESFSFTQFFKMFNKRTSAMYYTYGKFKELVPQSLRTYNRNEPAFI